MPSTRASPRSWPASRASSSRVPTYWSTTASGSSPSTAIPRSSTGSACSAASWRAPCAPARRSSSTTSAATPTSSRHGGDPRRGHGALRRRVEAASAQGAMNVETVGVTFPLEAPEIFDGHPIARALRGPWARAGRHAHRVCTRQPGARRRGQDPRRGGLSRREPPGTGRLHSPCRRTSGRTTRRPQGYGSRNVGLLLVHLRSRADVIRAVSAALAAVVLVAAPAHSGPGPWDQKADATRWARLVRPVVARIAPDPDARPLTIVRTATREGESNLVVVLAIEDGAGGPWAQVRLGDPPQRVTSGGCRAEHSARSTRCERGSSVDRERFRATLWRGERVVFRARIGVGQTRWPTPRGEFYVREKLAGFGDPFFGPVAVRNERPLAGPHRLAQGRLHRHPRHERARADPGPHLARLHPYAKRRRPAPRAAHASRHAGHDRLALRPATLRRKATMQARRRTPGARAAAP